MLEFALFWSLGYTNYVRNLQTLMYDVFPGKKILNIDVHKMHARKTILYKTWLCWPNGSYLNTIVNCERVRNLWPRSLIVNALSVYLLVGHHVGNVITLITNRTGYKDLKLLVTGVLKILFPNFFLYALFLANMSLYIHSQTWNKYCAIIINIVHRNKYFEITQSICSIMNCTVYQINPFTAVWFSWLSR